MKELFYSEDMKKRELEELAFNKTYRNGKCKSTVFASGGHRTGLGPMYRLHDGGLPGVVCQRICLECRKKFSETGFLPLQDPNESDPK